MYGKIFSGCVHGIEGKKVEVEIDIANGLPQINIVGLPGGAIRESAERVRAALKNSRFEFPLKRITVNLAPADLHKEGSAFDLAIAAGILTTSKQIRLYGCEKALIIGELSLDGAVRAVPGVLSMVQMAKAAGLKIAILPGDNAAEANLISDMLIVPVNRLEDLRELESAEKFQAYMNGVQIAEINDSRESNALNVQDFDYAEVKGQHFAKRAMAIAAAGMHNIMLVGPPGSGKTMLIRRLPTILPPMTEAEALEVTKIYSIAGKLERGGTMIRQRPFRDPHHTISQGGLIGGGSPPRPGEVSLAHHGVLFLDEMPEFPRRVLEVLRQPLEDRKVTLARARASYAFPSRFILAATMNPCPCGYYGHETETNPCSCHKQKIAAYRDKLSGPLLDRIDLHVDVPRVEIEELTNSSEPAAGKHQLTSKELREMVYRAHAVQQKRYAGTQIRYNGELFGTLLRAHCRLKQDAAQLLQQSFNALGLSARAYDRILKLARTIADLEQSETIELEHVAEAIQYRKLDQRTL
ncbi:MAG TPA: YifB family Mg chelatase-like AAA ATPase [Bacilli bacterium]